MFLAWFTRSSGSARKPAPSRGPRSRPPLRLEQLEDRLTPSILIPVANHCDLVYDPVHNILDITTGNGYVQQYNLTTQTLLAPVYVGGNLAGADITADGSALFIADQQPVGGQAVLHRLDLNHGFVSNLAYPLFPGGGGWSLALGPGTKGFVDEGGSGGSVPLLQFDVNTGFVQPRTDFLGSGGYGQIGPYSPIHHSADRSLFLITDEGGPPYNAFLTYSPQSNTFSGPYPVPTSLAGAMTAVNRNGTLFAVQLNGVTTVYNRNFQVVAQFGAMDGGVAFDPGLDLMYAVNTQAGQIVALDTNTWNFKYQLPIEESVPHGTPLGNGTMTVSNDGRWLFLATPSGVRAYLLPSAPGPAAQLRVTGFPAVTTAGQAGSITVTALDSYGRVVSGYLGTVHFFSSDPQAVLPADYTFTPTDMGSHTFTLSFQTAGTQTVTAFDTHAGSVYGQETGIKVVPGAVNSFLVSTNAANPQPAGYAFNVTVTALDAYRNVATNYTGKVRFFTTDLSRVLPPDHTFTAADQGRHTVSYTLNTAGSQSVSVKDSVNYRAIGSAGVTIANYIPGLYFTTGPATTTPTAGAPFSFTVTARDQYHNVATHYVGTVTFTTSDAGTGAAVPADYTFTAADAGVHTFTSGVTLVTAGGQTVTLRDKAYLTGATVTTTSFTVSPAAASTLKVTGFPSAVTAGGSGTFTVTASDAYGNVATGYSGTVHFTSSDAQAALPADATLTNGTGTFTATLKTAGTQSLTATDTANGALSVSEAGISVSPAAASTLRVAGFPSSVTAGGSAPFSVTAYDAYGNVAIGYSGTVHFTSSDAQAALPADVTLINGTGSFTATLKTAGTQSLTATDTANAALSGTEGGIAVSAAAASVLVLSAPSSVTAGVAFTFTLTALDAYGNVATGYTGTVHFSSSDALATLPADYTFTAADAGSHTFTATLNTSGSQSLTAADAGDALSESVGVLVLTP
jgi:hypothetical protein